MKNKLVEQELTAGKDENQKNVSAELGEELYRQNVNKLSKFRELLEEVLKDKDVYVRKTAEKYIPPLYQSLRKAGIQPVQARHIVVAQTVDRYWAYETIMKQLPEECKVKYRIDNANKTPHAKGMGSPNTEIDTRARVSRSGGTMTLQKYGPQFYSDMAKKENQTVQSILTENSVKKINDAYSVAVENGTRKVLLVTRRSGEFVSANAVEPQ